jgi:hypothetical protein
MRRRDLATALKDGGPQTSAGPARARLGLFSIAAQVTGCCVLLIVAGTTVRGLQRVLDADFGFEFERVAILDASLSRYGIGGQAARAYWEDVKRSVETNGEVEHLALASHGPLAASANRSIYNDAPRLSVTGTTVEPAFFPLLQIAIVAGRNFAPTDAPGTVAIISRRLAVEMYGSMDVVGKGFPRSKPDRTIVGIAADAPMVNVAATNVAEWYAPVGARDYGGLVLLASARRDARHLMTALRDAARDADSRVLPKTSRATTGFEARVQERRATSLAAGATGAVALWLACFGIFGLVAYASSTRTHEIGIRRALGASGGSIVWLLLRRLAIPVSGGMALGTLAGLGLGRILEGEPFYLPAADAITPFAALVIFAITAACAALVPVRRALRLDPLRALRHE